MNIILFWILLYLSIGLFWAKFLEGVCIKYEVLGGEPFSITEHIVAVLIWPISLLIFIGSILRGLFTGRFDE